MKSGCSSGGVCCFPWALHCTTVDLQLENVSVSVCAWFIPFQLVVIVMAVSCLDWVC